MKVKNQIYLMIRLQKSKFSIDIPYFTTFCVENRFLFFKVFNISDVWNVEKLLFLCDLMLHLEGKQAFSLDLSMISEN